MGYRTYIVFNYNEAHLIDFDHVRENSVDTLRISNDGLKTFVKYDGEICPHCIDSLTSPEFYTSEEIGVVLQGDNWVENQEI